MDAEREIRVSRDKLNILRVGGLIKRGGLNFMDVVKLIPKDKYLQQRASHVLIHTLQYHKYEPTEQEIVSLANTLKVDGMIEGAYRNILKTLDEIEEYPEEIESFLFDYCLQAMVSQKRPLAIRAFSIPLAYKIAKRHPELLLELQAILTTLSPEDGGSILVRRRDYLKKIQKELDNHSR